LNTLAGHLLPGERAEADNGYVGHPNKIKCPNNDCNPERNLGMQSAARSRHETFNGCLKNWEILERTYRHARLCITQEFPRGSLGIPFFSFSDLGNGVPF
jgi:hypothetical protein